MKKGEVQNETVFRDKEGKIVSLEEKLLTKKGKLKMANESILKEFQKGSKQIEEQKKLKREVEEAKEEPFARTEVSKEVEREMK